MNRLFQTLAVYAFLLIFLPGCAALYRNIEPPALQLISIATPGIGSDMTLQLTASVRITNPNDIGLPVRGGELQLAVNDSVIGNATINEGFMIGAGDSTVVELPAVLDLRGALDAGLAALRIGTTEIDYRLNGHIDLAVSYLGRVRVNESGQIKLGSNGN